MRFITSSVAAVLTVLVMVRTLMAHSVETSSSPDTRESEVEEQSATSAARVAGSDGHRASTPADIPRSGWLQVGKRTLAEIGADNVPMMAAAIAFAGMLSIVPLIIAAVSVFGLVVDPAEAARLSGELTATLPGSAAELLSTQIDRIAASEGSTLGVSLVLSVLAALWGASGGLSMLIKGIGAAYDEPDDRGFLKTRLLAIGFAIATMVFMLVAIVLITVVPSIIAAVGLGTIGTIAASIGRWIILALLMMIALAVLFRVAPDRSDAEWRWITPGSALSAVLWLVGSAGFSFFVENFGSYNQTYGALAGVVVLLLWLQVSALVVLIGAELNAELERQTAQDTTVGPDEPMGQRGADPADDVASTS